MVYSTLISWVPRNGFQESISLWKGDPEAHKLSISVLYAAIIFLSREGLLQGFSISLESALFPSPSNNPFNSNTEIQPRRQKKSESPGAFENVTREQPEKRKLHIAFKGPKDARPTQKRTKNSIAQSSQSLVNRSRGDPNDGFALISCVNCVQVLRYPAKSEVIKCPKCGIVFVVKEPTTQVRTETTLSIPPLPQPQNDLRFVQNTTNGDQTPFNFDGSMELNQTSNFHFGNLVKKPIFQDRSQISSIPPNPMFNQNQTALIPQPLNLPRKTLTTLQPSPNIIHHSPFSNLQKTVPRNPSQVTQRIHPKTLPAPPTPLKVSPVAFINPPNMLKFNPSIPHSQKNPPQNFPVQHFRLPQ